MDKSKEGKNFINRNALLGGVFVFAIAPMLINIGLDITDVIYANTGFTLTAKEFLEKEKAKVEEQEEINNSIALIRQESDYINGYARPNYIRCCKSYIDLRKQHANDIRSEGKVIKRQLEHKEL